MYFVQDYVNLLLRDSHTLVNAQLRKGAIISPKSGAGNDFQDLIRAGFALDLDDYYAAEIRQLTILQSLDAVLSATPSLS